ncbi:MAG: 50S ribosomal protein L3 [Candidatus Kerfeldbacteria bacterium]|nr:50S ribosomal protein L3 [Candidatus Kerfeldbacteria bacterium]
MKKTINKFLLAKKLYMTQVFDEAGNVVPVTVLAAEPNIVTQVKTADKDGYVAVQVGVGERRAKTVSKAVVGHTKGLNKVFRKLTEFRVTDGSTYTVGDAVLVSQFTLGDKVKVSGISKGLGFQGVIKRHGFHGQPASHGHKDQERASGSIGAGGVQRTFKDMRMAGHMGDQFVKLSNLKVVKVDTEKNELYLKGAVPGARNAMICIYQ